MTTSILTAADDATLLQAVSARRVEAVGEAYGRHATALYRLALVVAGDRERAANAVAGAYLALWTRPARVDLGGQSLCAALAGEVYGRCADAPSERALPEHALALALLGDHTPRRAIRRAGLSRDSAPAR